MPWGLTEEEQEALMCAVRDVIEPWETLKPSSIQRLNEATGKYEPMAIKVLAIKDDAPEEIKKLERVYGDIIDKGAVIGGRLTL